MEKRETDRRRVCERERETETETEKQADRQTDKNKHRQTLTEKAQFFVKARAVPRGD